MKRIISLLMILTFLETSQAAPTCSTLFESHVNFNGNPFSKKFKIYDPSSTDQQIDALLRRGELGKLKNANPRKTHLPYFEDFVLDTVDRLVKLKSNENPEISRVVDYLGVEAYKRIAQEALTYEWIIEFSYRARALFSGKPIPMFANLERRINAFPHDIMIPTFARQDFRHFIEIEGHQFTFTAMRELREIVDGAPRLLTPEENDHHDYRHYFLTQKNDAVANPKHKYYRLWMNLHSSIAAKIEELPESRRRNTEYVYFYFLHEEFGMRTGLVRAYLDPNRLSPSKFVGVILTHDLIKGNDKTLMNRSEIYRRTSNPMDFMSAFPEKTNPQEVLLVGIGDLIKILEEIESERAF